jgi:hypothetical protein
MNAMVKRFRTPIVVLACMVASPCVVWAQEKPGTVVLRGEVRDAERGTPLPGARIRIDRLRRGTLADDAGAFEFERVPNGVHVLTVEHYGYAPIEATVDATPESVPVFRLVLTPLPVMLDGLTVVADRLELMESRLTNRRRAVAVSTRAFGVERLQRSASSNVLDFLAIEASLAGTPCARNNTGRWCVWRRGQIIEPRVYIDEAPAVAGIDQLSTYRTYDLYLVEVYSQGQEIRAYTHQFMERMARRPVHLIPIGVGLQR